MRFSFIFIAVYSTSQIKKLPHGKAFYFHSSNALPALECFVHILKPNFNCTKTVTQMNMYLFKSRWLSEASTLYMTLRIWIYDSPNKQPVAYITVNTCFTRANATRQKVW